MARDESSKYHAALDAQLAGFIDEHRQMLASCLDGLSEAEVRQRLVPSETTLLGLVKHATFVERVWFEEAITCRPRHETGIEAGPEESFRLHATDSIGSVRAAFVQACNASRRATANLSTEDLVEGNRRGPLPLRWVYMHVLREHAQHCGHADILREQVLAGRAT